MFFELRGKTYKISFSRLGTMTVAELSEVDSEGKLVHLGIYGTARVYYKDQFQKKVGRKVALTNLINVFNEPNFDEVPALKFLTKEERAEIWNAYFRHHRK